MTARKMLFGVLLVAFNVSFPYVAQATQPRALALIVSPDLNLRVREWRPDPEKPILGDILYLTGFADRSDNHGPLFEQWVAEGFRVISFDYPSHGETSGAQSNINNFDFRRLSALASFVERSTRESPSRPLLLAGWSTGGLLAVRIAQSKKLNLFTRPLKGLLLFAPGVAVRPLVGMLGIVTEGTLTRNPSPPHQGPIKPRSPLLKPRFAASLLVNSLLAQHDTMPLDLPMLVVLAGDKTDRYVKSREILDWIRKKNRRAPAMVYQFDQARHELDNEPGDVGTAVREIAAHYAVRFVRQFYCERSLDQ